MPFAVSGLEGAIKANLSILATFPPAAGSLSFRPAPLTCGNANPDGLGSRIRLGKVATVDTFTFPCQLATGGFGTAQWGD